MTTSAHHLFLSLGTNLGDRLLNLRQAVSGLEDAGLVVIDQISPVYETEPWGVADQPRFLNLCLEAHTRLSPSELLSETKLLERRLGRVPGERWGPRVIDIDLLTYDDGTFEDDRLSLPHPGISDRAFVLLPLADIAPTWRHPISGASVQELLDGHDLSGLKRLPLPLIWGRRTYVMGVLNVTPDSFSGDGLMRAGEDDLIQRAVRQAEEFVVDGADIIDIGGESTRPGSQPITTAEEQSRVVPLISAVRQAVRVPISVDTYRSQVAAAALEAGANWVNDVWGLRMDPEMAAVVAGAGCPVVIMHNRSRPRNVDQQERLGGRYVGIEYDDLIPDVIRELQSSIDHGLSWGIRPEQIVVDPGIGFGKSIAQNLRLINELGALRSLGYPLLVGTSRKSFIGYTLDLPPEDRVEGTAATVAIAIDRGADIVRVHDVRQMVRVARMTDSIVRAKRSVMEAST